MKIGAFVGLSLSIFGWGLLSSEASLPPTCETSLEARTRETGQEGPIPAPSTWIDARTEVATLLRIHDGATARCKKKVEDERKDIENRRLEIVAKIDECRGVPSCVDPLMKIIEELRNEDRAARNYFQDWRMRNRTQVARLFDEYARLVLWKFWLPEPEKFFGLDSKWKVAKFVDTSSGSSVSADLVLTHAESGRIVQASSLCVVRVGNGDPSSAMIGMLDAMLNHDANHGRYSIGYDLYSNPVSKAFKRVSSMAVGHDSGYGQIAKKFSDPSGGQIVYEYGCGARFEAR